MTERAADSILSHHITLPSVAERSLREYPAQVAEWNDLVTLKELLSRIKVWVDGRDDFDEHREWLPRCPFWRWNCRLA